MSHRPAAGTPAHPYPTPPKAMIRNDRAQLTPSEPEPLPPSPSALKGQQDLPHVIAYLEKMMRELPAPLARFHAQRALPFYVTRLGPACLAPIRQAMQRQYAKTHGHELPQQPAID